MARPRLLFIAPRYLLPADSGGKIRTGHVLRGLKGGHFDVTLISPAPDGAAARDAAELALMSDRFASWPEVERGPLFAYSRLRHLPSRLPIPVATDVSEAGRRLVARELARRPDLVVVDFPHTAVLLPEEIAPPTVIFTHNVEAEIFARHERVAGNSLRRVVWRDQFAKMRRFEREVLRRFDTVIAVSERDRDHFRREYGVDPAVIPTGVDLDYFAYQPPDPSPEVAPIIVFTASMDSAANIDGMQWFMDAVWPFVVAAVPSARVTVVGRNPNAKLVQAAKERGLPWHFTGFVDDVRPYVHEAAAYVIPLRVGGGTRIKAYEAMALGRPVVSTLIGVEGLSLEPGRHYLLADTAEAFAHSVGKVLRDGALRLQLAGSARQLVEASFSAGKAAEVFQTICINTLERVVRTAGSGKNSRGGVA